MSLPDRTRPGARPAPRRTPAHRADAPQTPPTGDRSRGSLARAAVRATAVGATLAVVAGVTLTSSQDAAEAVDPAPTRVAFALTAQSVSAAHPTDALVATAALPAQDARRLAAQAAAVRAAQHERAQVSAALAKAEEKRQDRIAAARREAAREAAERRAEERRAAQRRAARDAARDPKGVARLMAASRGWGSGQFSCLESLWQKESGWDVHADNPTSSAYGIPQALPGSKMSSAGSDWATNPVTQIRWGLGYIADRYGTPCAAWAHSGAHNWY